MKRMLWWIALVAWLVVPAFAQAPKEKADKSLIDQVYRSVALLYSQDSSGSMKMHCTATAYQKSDAGYRFASAAHCIGSDDTTKERSASASNQAFFVTFDGTDGKVFHPAKVVGVGYQHRGDDLAVLAVDTKEAWPVVPLGDEKKETVTDEEGAPVLNVASPLGLGRQVFHGYVSSLFLDRPLVEGDIN